MTGRRTVTRGRDYGECTDCHHSVALRRSGLLFAHGKRDMDDQWCRGSGKPPVAKGDPVLLQVLIDPHLRALVQKGCDRLDTTPPDLARDAIREYLCRH